MCTVSVELCYKAKCIPVWSWLFATLHSHCCWADATSRIKAIARNLYLACFLPFLLPLLWSHPSNPTGGSGECRVGVSALVGSGTEPGGKPFWLFRWTNLKTKYAKNSLLPALLQIPQYSRTSSAQFWRWCAMISAASEVSVWCARSVGCRW